jgi:hypothetical protein
MELATAFGALSVTLNDDFLRTGRAFSLVHAAFRMLSSSALWVVGRNLALWVDRGHLGGQCSPQVVWSWARIVFNIDFLKKYLNSMVATIRQFRAMAHDLNISR